MSDLSNLVNLSTPANDDSNLAVSPKNTSFKARLAARFNRIGEVIDEGLGKEPPELDRYIDDDYRLTDKPSSARGR